MERYTDELEALVRKRVKTLKERLRVSRELINALRLHWPEGDQFASEWIEKHLSYVEEYEVAIEVKASRRCRRAPKNIPLRFKK